VAAGGDVWALADCEVAIKAMATAEKKLFENMEISGRWVRISAVANA